VNLYWNIHITTPDKIFSSFKLTLLWNEIFVRKLTMLKINLIIQLIMYRNNDPLAVNMNNTSTTQIEIRSQKATQTRQIDNRSINEITIVS
jgi:hypothetical protein